MDKFCRCPVYFYSNNAYGRNTSSVNKGGRAAFQYNGACNVCNWDRSVRGVHNIVSAIFKAPTVAGSKKYK